jgi:hypothetical protein
MGTKRSQMIMRSFLGRVRQGNAVRAFGKQTFAIIMAWGIPTRVSAALDIEQVVSAGIEAETVGKTKIGPVATDTDCRGRVACTTVEDGIGLGAA